METLPIQPNRRTARTNTRRLRTGKGVLLPFPHVHIQRASAVETGQQDKGELGLRRHVARLFGGEAAGRQHLRQPHPRVTRWRQQGDDRAGEAGVQRERG